jgi:hypothetical protein
MEMGDNHRERVMFLVTDMENHDILLGTDWLKVHNPKPSLATLNPRLRLAHT